MFTKLLDFSYKRTPLQALGFYLAYLFLSILIGFLFGALAGLLYSGSTSDQALYENIIKGGIVLVVLLSPAICLLILKTKGLLNNFGYILIVVLSAILAFFGGAILALIPAAFLTTRGK